MPLCPLLSSLICPISVSTSHFTVRSFCSVCPLLFSESVQYLSVPHTVPSLGSVSLWPMLSSLVRPMSGSNSHYTVCWFCVTMSIVDFYSLSVSYTVKFVDCLSVTHRVPSAVSVLMCPMHSSKISPMWVSTSHC